MTSAALGWRHGGTLGAAVLLIGAARTPLTGRGVGSAARTIDMVRLASDLSWPPLQWGARLMVVVLTTGLTTGVALAIEGRWARRVWWVASGLCALCGGLIVVLLRDNLGLSPVLIAGAGVLLCVSGLLDGRVRRRHAADQVPLSEKC